MTELKVPVRDETELITSRTLGELPDALDDAEEKSICFELLMLTRQAAAPADVTVGQMLEVVESMPPGERRLLVEALRKNAKLCSLKTVEQRQARDIATKYATFDPRPTEIVLLPSGALGDRRTLDDEAALEQQRQRTIAARRQTELAQRQIEAAALATSQQERDDALLRELPRSFRRP